MIWKIFENFDYFTKNAPVQPILDQKFSNLFVKLWYFEDVAN